MTGPKQTQCLHELLQNYFYPDTRLASELRAGFPLVGWLEPSGLWPTDVQAPALTLTGLEAVADDISRHTARAVARAPAGPTRDAIWAATVAERDQDWLTTHPDPPPLPGRVVSVRFGVEQKNQIRPIDNFKGSKINAACGAQEKVQIDGIDQIVQAALTFLRHGLPAAAGDRLQGRTWDLKSAYKQLAVRSDHKHLAWIAVVDPTTNTAQGPSFAASLSAPSPVSTLSSAAARP